MAQANLSGLQAALATQSEAVDGRKAANDAATLHAQAAADTAQARTTLAQEVLFGTN